MTIAGQRARFAIPGEVHYLNCAYMAPLSKKVSAAMIEGARLKEQPWNFRPADFFAVTEEFRDKAARLTGVAADSIAVVPSVSYGLAIAAKNIPMEAGQTVVTLGDQFPSNVYVWQEKAARCGGEIVAVQRPTQSCWSEAVLDAIGPETAVVAVPHNHWADGRLVDLFSVGEKARRHGAALVLDLTQSLGAMPLDFDAVKPDFAVAACYKWLMGPYGIGMLYVDPKYHEGEPIEHNWINRAGSEDFARLVDYRSDFQPGARRFDMGEKSNAPLLKGAGAGMDFLLEFGIEEIARDLGRRTEALAKEAQALGLTSAEIGTRAPHFLALKFPEDVPGGLTEKLAGRQVHVSLRGTSLRVTPHLYNTPSDSDALIQTLRDCLA